MNAAEARFSLRLSVGEDWARRQSYYSGVAASSSSSVSSTQIAAAPATTKASDNSTVQNAPPNASAVANSAYKPQVFVRKKETAY